MSKVGLREICSKSSSLFYFKYPQKWLHYTYNYAQNLLIILIILDFTCIFTVFKNFCNQNVQQNFAADIILLRETVTAY